MRFTSTFSLASSEKSLCGADVNKWRAKCRCTHGHESHDPGTLACRRAGCGCGRFFSAFCCLICDREFGVVAYSYQIWRCNLSF